MILFWINSLYLNHKQGIVARLFLSIKITPEEEAGILKINCSYLVSKWVLQKSVCTSHGICMLDPITW